LAEEPEDDISLIILNEDGDVIRTLTSELIDPYLAAGHPDSRPNQKASADITKNKGMNRVSWDLAYEGAVLIPDSTNDAGNPDDAPMVAPGNFRVRLVVGEQSFEQTLTVLPDPRADALIENIQAQNSFLLGVRDRISTISTDAIRIRSMREQLEAHHGRLGDDPAAARLKELGEAALEALREVELAIYSPDAIVNYDILAGREGGAKLYSRFGWLYNGAFDHFGPPTQGMTEVDADLSALHDEAKAELERILSEDIAQLNSLAGELGIDYIVY